MDTDSGRKDPDLGREQYKASSIGMHILKSFFEAFSKFFFCSLQDSSNWRNPEAGRGVRGVARYVAYVHARG